MKRGHTWIFTAALLAASLGCETGGGLELQTEDPDSGLRDLGLDEGAEADAGEDAAQEDTGKPPRADAAADAEPRPDLAPPVPDAGNPVEVSWPLRSCEVSVRVDAPGAAEVLLAGEFTGWADAPLPMSFEEGAFTLTLGPDQGLQPGRLYAYKIIADGQWRIPRDATHRKYDGDCVNGGLLAPACDAAPEIKAGPVSVDGELARVRVELFRATDGSPLTEVEVLLDGEAVGYQVANLALQIDVPAGPGKHRLSIRARDEAGRDAAPVDLPFWVEEAPFDWRDTVLYMLLVDRFANGDRDADEPVGEPVTYPADWHGGDLFGAAQVIESGYFDRLGVKAIWLSPLNAQVEGHWPERGGGEQRIAAYHGYWPIRGREVERRFGGNAGLKAFVEAAHARGIRVLLDLINNQVHEQHEYFVSNPEWFRTGCVCGIDPGCGWSERPLDCLFAGYLPDINWRNAGAEQRFIEDAVWWIEEFDVDGFRVDAVKHVETTSIYNLRAEISRRFEQGGERIVMLGETAVGEGDSFDDGCGEQYGTGYEWIAAYTGRTGLDGQFDFPTHHRMRHGTLTGEGGYDGIEETLRVMEQRYDPASLHVRFLGSHDSSRMATVAAQDPQAGCRFAGPGCDPLPQTVQDPAVYDTLARAWTLLLTMPGIPLLYYGDELALPGANDPDSRRDMLWTGDLAELAMEGAAPTERQGRLREWIETVAAARAAHPALTRGDRQVLVAEPELYIYLRTEGEDAAIVVLNRGGEVQRDLQVDAPDMQVVAGPLEGQLSGGQLGLRVPAGASGILGVIQ